MKITQLGGGREVGASAILIELSDGTGFLLDFGMRINPDETENREPRLDLLQNKDVQFCIISHAHLDHSGSIPKLAELFRDIPIYMTKPTKDIATVLLLDSARLMEGSEKELPSYNPRDVDNVLTNNVRVEDFDRVFEPVSDKPIKVKFIRAGHILGAAMVYIETPEGNILYTGDFMTKPQLTVPGCDVPTIKSCKPNILICESTYGSRVHPPRSDEEEKLFSAIVDVLEKGGKVLIPVFAVGRAQEIIFALRNKMVRHRKQYRVYVDGMVREINRIYNKYSMREIYVTDRFKSLLKEEDIFDNELIVPVNKPEEREKIVKQKEPCIILSSSGMLSGGPSVFYAKHLVEGEENMIALVGYQDEESNGYRLLRLAEESDPEKKEIELEGKTYKVKCRVQRFGFSAHADMNELKSFLKGIKCDKLVLVHGDEESLKSLSDAVKDTVDTHVPQNGDQRTFYFESVTNILELEVMPSLEKNEKLTEENIHLLWEYLVNSGYEDIVVDETKLRRLWSSDMQLSDDLKSCVLNTPYFSIVGRSGKSYKVLSREECEKKANERMEQNVLKEAIEEIYATHGYNGEVSVSFYRDEGKAIIRTPQKPEREEEIKEKLSQLSKQSRWQIEAKLKPTAQSVAQFVRETFGIVCTVSFGIRKIILKFPNVVENIEKITEEVRNRFGYEVVCEVPDRTPVQPPRGVDMNRVREEILSFLRSKTEYVDLGYKGSKVILKLLTPEHVADIENELFILREKYSGKLVITVNDTYCNQARIREIVEEVCGKYDIPVLGTSLQLPEGTLIVKVSEQDVSKLQTAGVEIENRTNLETEWEVV